MENKINLNIDPESEIKASCSITMKETPKKEENKKLYQKIINKCKFFIGSII